MMPVMAVTIMMTIALGYSFMLLMIIMMPTILAFRI